MLLFAAALAFTTHAAATAPEAIEKTIGPTYTLDPLILRKPNSPPIHRYVACALMAGLKMLQQLLLSHLRVVYACVRVSVSRARSQTHACLNTRAGSMPQNRLKSIVGYFKCYNK